TAGQPASALRKDHLIPIPAMADKRSQPGMLRGGQVGLMEGPGMIATEPVTLLQQQHLQVRALLMQAPGNQSIGQPCAGQHDIVAHRHRRPSASTGLPVRITASTISAATGVPPAASTSAPSRARLPAKPVSFSNRCSKVLIAALEQKRAEALRPTPAWHTRAATPAWSKAIGRASIGVRAIRAS